MNPMRDAPHRVSDHTKNRPVSCPLYAPYVTSAATTATAAALCALDYVKLSVFAAMLCAAVRYSSASCWCVCGLVAWRFVNPQEAAPHARLSLPLLPRVLLRFWRNRRRFEMEFH
jgi:hypothetical protein